MSTNREKVGSGEVGQGASGVVVPWGGAVALVVADGDGNDG